MVLTLDCPHCEGNPDFCPLHAVRKLEVWDKVKWVVGLATEDLAYLSVYHEVCLRWRRDVADLKRTSGETPLAL